jgi:hypothetical protein
MRRFVEGVDRGQRTLFPECLEDWIASPRRRSPGPLVSGIHCVLLGLIRRKAAAPSAFSVHCGPIATYMSKFGLGDRL